jgi:hypothetical protein
VSCCSQARLRVIVVSVACLWLGKRETRGSTRYEGIDSIRLLRRRLRLTREGKSEERGAGRGEARRGECDETAQTRERKVLWAQNSSHRSAPRSASLPTSLVFPF